MFGFRTSTNSIERETRLQEGARVSHVHPPAILPVLTKSVQIAKLKMQISNWEQESTEEAEILSLLTL
jgi:hypothetical protein